MSKLHLYFLASAGALLSLGIFSGETVLTGEDHLYISKMIAFAILIVVLSSLLIISWLDARASGTPPTHH